MRVGFPVRVLGRGVSFKGQSCRQKMVGHTGLGRCGWEISPLNNISRKEVFHIAPGTYTCMLMHGTVQHESSYECYGVRHGCCMYAARNCILFYISKLARSGGMTRTVEEMIYITVDCGLWNDIYYCGLWKKLYIFFSALIFRRAAASTFGSGGKCCLC